MTRIRKCKRHGCNNSVPQSEGRGRPQKYCRHACKIAAFRRRHRHRGARKATAGPAEWYTPGWIIELARYTLGEIDMDPSSDETAQAIVKAGMWYGVGRPDADGGLSPGAEWGGKCWMNPPYGKLLKAFIERLIAEVDSGHVTQALVLTSVHAMSSLSSGQPLMRASVASCVLSGRLTFWGEHSTGSTSTFGSVVTALGSGLDVERFTRVWSPRGAVSASG